MKIPEIIFSEEKMKRAETVILKVGGETINLL